MPRASLSLGTADPSPEQGTAKPMAAPLYLEQEELILQVKLSAWFDLFVSGRHSSVFRGA